jgi:hypothetical protein
MDDEKLGDLTLIDLEKELVKWLDSETLVAKFNSQHHKIGECAYMNEV